MKRIFTMLIFLAALVSSSKQAGAQPCPFNTSVTATLVSGNTYFLQGSWTGSGTPAYQYLLASPGNFYITADSATYTFPGPGLYQVCYMAADSNCGDSTCVTVSVGGGNCTSFASVNTNGLMGMFYHNTLFPSGWNWNYHWDFGDGSSSTNGNTNHTYASPGIYTAIWTMFAYDPTDSTQNCLITDTVIVNMNLQSCNLAATMSAVPTGNPGQYQLTRGFNNPGPGWSVTSHLYINGIWALFPNPYTTTLATGTHTICNVVSAYDSTNATTCYDTACVTVVVPPGCQAGFTLIPDSITAGNYYGYNTSTGNNLSYLWDFGDNTTSTAQYPSHQYASTGIYVICLTVTDTVSNCTSTFCDSAGVMKAGISSISIINPATVGMVEQEDNFSSSVMPNPLSNHSVLNIQSASSGIFELNIHTITGQLIFSENVSVQAGQNVFDIDASSFHPGVYILHLSKNGQLMSSQKLIK